jgi:membrane associated rhomboid family serine protease
MDTSGFQFATASPAASLLLLAIVVVGLVALFMAPSWIERGVFRPYWLLRRGEYFTLLSSAFLHADLPHLIFNGFTFWAFAFSLEPVMGTPRFLALYAVGLLASDLGTYLKQRHNPDYQCLGASGAILAVLFASLVYFPTSSLFILPIPVPIPAPLFALGYLAYSVYAAGHAKGRVNHDAHLSGAVAGLVFVAVTDGGAVARAVQQVSG